MMALVDILLAQAPEPRKPWATLVWVAALVVLSVLSYLARKAAEKAEQGQKKREMTYKADTEATEGEGGRPPLPPASREPHRPPAQVRHATPVPASAPAMRNVGHTRKMQVAPGTITEVHPGSLSEARHLQPIAISETVAEPMPPPETPGRLAPAALAAAVAGPIGNRIDLQGRDQAVLAVIYSEILGPPKALRDRPERWDV